MHLFSFLLMLQSLFQGTVYADLAWANWLFLSSTPTSNASPSSTPASTTGSGTSCTSFEKFHLTCHPGFPMAKTGGSAVLVEACASMERKRTLLMKHLNVGEELLQYIDPAIPERLLKMEFLAFLLEETHGCRTSDRDRTYCTWLSQLRGELRLLDAKMGRSDKSIYHDIAPQTFILDLWGAFQSISQIATNLAAYLSAPFSFLRNALSSSMSPGPDGASDQVGKGNEVPQA